MTPSSSDDPATPPGDPIHDGRAPPARPRRFRLRRSRESERASVSTAALGGDAFATPAGYAPAVRKRRNVYLLLPNAFTTGNLFAGFYAIVMGMNDQFAAAAIAIFLAMFLDSLDGRIARLTNTQSAFGEQYDSLADVISFGAAPALVMYAWALKGMGKLGWLAAFIYVAGAALRLARFNTNIGVVDKRYFQGLPSPAAAALVAGFIWVATDLRETRWITWTGADLGWLGWLVTVYAGLSMVSNSPFHSFKEVNFRRSVPFIFLILVVLGFVLISSDPPLVLFLLFVAYGLSGNLLALWRWWRGQPSPARAGGPAAPAAEAATVPGQPAAPAGQQTAPATQAAAGAADATTGAADATTGAAQATAGAAQATAPSGQPSAPLAVATPPPPAGGTTGAAAGSGPGGLPN